jgi:hypothetical protein
MRTCHFARMVELRFATVVEAGDSEENCSWSSVVRGIERYAAYHSRQADDLYEWADLIEGIRQLREGR